MQDWKLLICKTQPDGRRGATLLPAEGNTWQVTLAEINGRGAPKTDEEFLEFARSLPDQTAYHALLRSEAITPGETPCVLYMPATFCMFQYRRINNRECSRGSCSGHLLSHEKRASVL
jgi:hypothetical protein